MKKDPMFPDISTSLEDILREGARKLLQQAIENEVIDFLERHAHKKDENDKRIVKRNGYSPERDIQTGIGPVPIKQPRIRGEQFTSAILPKYLRRLPSIEALIPALYLKGVSTGNSAIFQQQKNGLVAQA